MTGSPVNLFTITSLIAAVFCFSMSMYSLLKSKSDRSKLYFSLTTFLVGIWTLFPLATTFASTPEMQTKLARIIYIAACYTPISFMYLVGALIGKKSSTYRFLCRAIFVLGTLFALALPSPYFIQGVQSSGVFRAVAAGPLYKYYVGYFAVFFAYSLWVLLNATRHAEGIKKIQLTYIFVGFVLGCLGGGIHFYAVYAHKEPFPHDIFIIMFPLIPAYAIIKHRLMEVNLVLRYATIHIVYLLIVGAPTLWVIWIVNSPVLTALCLLGVVMVSPFVYGALSKPLTLFVDRLPGFRGRYEKYRNVQGALRRLDGSATAESLSKVLISVVAAVFDPRAGAVLLKDSSTRGYLIKAGFGFTPVKMAYLSVAETSELVAQLRQNQTIVVTETVRLSPPINAGLLEDLEFLDSDICVPLILEGDLYGLLTLSKKLNSRVYNDLDMVFLDNLAARASLVLHLLTKTNDQTMRSTSLAHDLYRPFGPKGIMRSLKQWGNRSDVPEDLRRVIARLVIDMDFVGNHLLSTLQAKNNQEDSKSFLLSEAFDRTRVTFQEEATERGIQWQVDAPPADIIAEGDPETIRFRVINNLVENAFRHTSAGGVVHLFFRLEPNFIIGIVRDTGEGVAPGNISKLFDHGFQASPKAKGIGGLGLFSAKKVIESYGGKIAVESRLGQGAQFEFWIPMKS